MPKHLEKLLQQVYSCDTEAGHRLKYIFTKALACEFYARRINFIVHGGSLFELFLWPETLEGWKYWRDIWNLLKKAS